MDPGIAIAYRGRGKVLFELQEFQLALEDLNEAIRLDPSHGGSFFNRGLVHRQIGHLDQSCADLEQAKALGVKMASKALQTYCLAAN
jgi:tetratricopeptide (TPR) repeat protein